jgi:hypothetical protein
VGASAERASSAGTAWQWHIAASKPRLPRRSFSISSGRREGVSSHQWHARALMRYHRPIGAPARPYIYPPFPSCRAQFRSRRQKKPLSRPPTSRRSHGRTLRRRRRRSERLRPLHLARGGGSRALRVGYMAPPDMRAPSGWRLSAGGITIPLEPRGNVRVFYPYLLFR